jgi:Ca2+-transporting ATPase
MQNRLMLAQTFAFITLSTSELFRAFTARSEFYPLLKIGIFTNKSMNYAVLLSVALVMIVLYIPGLNTNIFRVLPLNLIHWAEIIPLLLIPSIAAEVTKAIQIRQNK